MQTYRNDKHGFELNVPEEWAVLKSGSGKTALSETIAFKCQYFEAFEIQISQLSSEPSPEHIERDFRNFAQKFNASSLKIGRILVECKEHTWARYYLGGGKWVKKYQLIIAGRQYTLTARCFYQNLLLEREKVWDAVVASFRSITTAKAIADEPKKPAKDGASFPRLVTYRNNKLGFEIDVPEEWPKPKSLAEDSLIFDHSPLETLNFIVGFLLPERLLEYTEFEFRLYAQRQGHTDLKIGRIAAGGKEHIWARYQMATGVWAKKYMIMFAGVEYAITASCRSQQTLAERERIWDTVVQSFRLSKWREQDIGTLNTERAKTAGNIYQSAYAAAAEGRYPEACTLLEQCLRENPDHVLAHKELAFILKNIGQVSAAVPHRQAVKRLAPADTVNRFNLAGLYAMLGAKENALQEIDELIALEPNNGMFQQFRLFIQGYQP